MRRQELMDEAHNAEHLWIWITGVILGGALGLFLAMMVLDTCDDIPNRLDRAECRIQLAAEGEAAISDNCRDKLDIPTPVTEDALLCRIERLERATPEHCQKAS